MDVLIGYGGRGGKRARRPPRELHILLWGKSMLDKRAPEANVHQLVAIKDAEGIYVCLLSTNKSQ